MEEARNEASRDWEGVELGSNEELLIKYRCMRAPEWMTPDFSPRLKHINKTRNSADAGEICHRCDALSKEDPCLSVVEPVHLVPFN